MLDAILQFNKQVNEELDKLEATLPYACPSYYDDNNVLQDCTCGKCK